MVIEAKAGLLQTVAIQKSIKPVLTGERAWVHLTESRLLSVASSNGDTRVEAVSAQKGEETILYEETRMSHGVLFLERKIEATGDAINNPDQPWSGRIRRVNP